MLEKHRLPDQDIIACLSIHYGIEVVTLTLLLLGADLNTTVYKADAKDLSSYFVKIKQGYHHDISIAVVELLHHAGLQQIIPPVKSIHGESSQRIGELNLVLYPFIEGQNGFSLPLTDEQWLILGRTLRKIHDTDVPISMQQTLRKEMYSPKWREIVRSIYQQIQDVATHDEIALKLLVCMKKNQAAIHRLVDRAEQLAKALRNESPKWVLCHSDLHGGNVLIHGAHSIYIVDWDEPIMAPKERDLMFIGGGVGNIWNKPREAALFYQGYGKTEINRKILAYYRHERIVEDIAIYAEQLLLTSAGGTDRAEIYKHFISMFEPNGVIDIAFATDAR